MPTTTEHRLARAFLGLLLALAALGVWQWRNGPPIATDLLSLLPMQQTQDPLQTLAQARVQAPLNHTLLALVGSANKDNAVASALRTADAWRASGLFTHVEAQPLPALASLRDDLAVRRLAFLPASTRATLLTNDSRPYFEQRAREISDPFSGMGLMPQSQDWLGLGRRVESALLQPGGRLHYDLATGTVTTEHNGTWWVLLRATLAGSAFEGVSATAVATLVDATRHRLAQNADQLLAVGGVLYAAASETQAMREARWISALSLLGIAALIGLSLRRWRAAWLFLPVGVGLACGLITCVALFGSIHVLTLVIGSTLIGVVVDFPLHWLSKCYGLPAWRPWPVLRRVRGGLTIMLVVNTIGYLALGATPFPALQQTAVFSAAGLFGAYGCTVCLMPALLRDWQPVPWPPLRRAGVRLRRATQWLHRHAWRSRLFWCLVVVFCAVGIPRLDTRDDLRDWVRTSPSLSDDAHQVALLTGFMPTSQFLLLRAPDSDTLLARHAALTTMLERLRGDGALGDYLSLDQILTPPATQRSLQARLNALAEQPAAWQALLSLGLPDSLLAQEFRTVAGLPVLEPEAALQTPLASRWQPNWLGRHGDEVGAVITLAGLSDPDRLHVDMTALYLDGVALVDPNGTLNMLFDDTRQTAAILKALSYGLAGLLLWLTLGKQAAWRILLPPAAATLCSLATFGLLYQPLTLFSLFGLLLVSAMGIDYAILMHERVAGAAASLVGLLLSAATTLLAFGLLALSATPAVASFGLAVSVGVGYSVLFAALMPPKRHTRPVVTTGAPSMSLSSRTTLWNNEKSSS